jgi:hypothetical protein
MCVCWDKRWWCSQSRRLLSLWPELWVGIWCSIQECHCVDLLWIDVGQMTTGSYRRRAEVVEVEPCGTSRSHMGWKSECGMELLNVLIMCYNGEQRDLWGWDERHFRRQVARSEGQQEWWTERSLGLRQDILESELLYIFKLEWCHMSWSSHFIEKIKFDIFNKEWCYGEVNECGSS